MDILTLVIYFFVGTVQDFFFTLNSRYISEKKVGPAVAFSFLTILMSMLVLYNILKDINSQSSILAIVIYSCGIAFGTFLAMKLPSLKSKNK